MARFPFWSAAAIPPGRGPFESAVYKTLRRLEQLLMNLELGGGGVGTPGTNGQDGADGFRPTVIMTAADQAFLSSTAFTDHPDMVFDVVAGHRYTFEFYLNIKSAVATTGPRVNMTFPAHTEFHFSATVHGPAITTDGTGREYFGTIEATTGSVNLTGWHVVGGSGFNAILKVFGVYAPTVSGQMKVGFASEVNGSAITVIKNSILLLWDWDDAGSGSGGSGSVAAATAAALGTVKINGTPTDAANPTVYVKEQADTLLAAKVPTTRSISTTAPLQGGGDMSANRALTISQATTAAVGTMRFATNGENSAGCAVQGNDSRLSDARTPVAHDAALITSGTMDLARLPTITTAKGGTGLVAIGAPGEQLGVNALGTGLEWQPAGGSGTVVAGKPKFKRKAADQSTTSNVLSAVTSLVCPIEAGKHYRVEFVVQRSAAGIEFAIQLPGGTTLSSSTMNVVDTTPPTSDVATIVFLLSSVVDAGDVQLLFKSTDGISSVTVFSGSHVILTELEAIP